MSASYLGTVETALHLVLYEKLKTVFSQSLKTTEGASPTWTELAHWVSTSGAAGSAKLAANLLTYPHEVRCYPSFDLGALLTVCRLSEPG